MTARAPLADYADYDDACPTLEIQTPFAPAPSSGVWPSQPSAGHSAQLRAAAPVAASAYAYASQDPANSTLLDAVVPSALSTWQNERLLAADASLALAPREQRARARTSTAPLPKSLAPKVASPKISLKASPDASISPNGTLSPDGTLLPWRHERPPSRKGTVALALVFALVASAGATVGFLRSANQPVAVAARVARTPAPGVRQLQLDGTSEIKREAPAPAPRGRRAE